MAKHPRQEHGQRDDVGLLLGHERDHLAEGHLGSVPLAKAGEAVEDLLDRQIEQRELDSLRAKVAHVLVRVDGKGEREFHRKSAGSAC
jgi:hypothetical protein